MKSTEVYSTLKAHLAPVFQAAGFKRAKAMLSWARRQGDRYVVVWCQVSQDGRDDTQGQNSQLSFSSPMKRSSALVTFIGNAFRKCWTVMGEGSCGPSKTAQLNLCDTRSRQRAYQSTEARRRMPAANRPMPTHSEHALLWLVRPGRREGASPSPRARHSVRQL